MGRKIQLGSKVKDLITGYEGTVTAKTEYLHRESMYLVESVDTTGRPIEWWVDKNRLKVVEG